MRENRFANPRINVEISYVSTISEKQNASLIICHKWQSLGLPLANLMLFLKCDAISRKKNSLSFVLLSCCFCCQHVVRAV